MNTEHISGNIRSKTAYKKIGMFFYASLAWKNYTMQFLFIFAIITMLFIVNPNTIHRIDWLTFLSICMISIVCIFMRIIVGTMVDRSFEEIDDEVIEYIRDKKYAGKSAVLYNMNEIESKQTPCWQTGCCLQSKDKANFSPTCAACQILFSVSSSKV